MRITFSMTKMGENLSVYPVPLYTALQILYSTPKNSKIRRPRHEQIVSGWLIISYAPKLFSIKKKKNRHSYHNISKITLSVTRGILPPRCYFYIVIVKRCT